MAGKTSPLDGGRNEQDSGGRQNFALANFALRPRAKLASPSGRSCCQGEAWRELRVAEIKLSSVIFASGDRTVVRKVGETP